MAQSIGTHLRKSVIAVSTAVAITAHSGTFAAEERTPQPVRLVAQPLAEALVEVGRQYGVMVVASDGLTANKSAPAVNGNLTIRQVIQQLLDGSGLAAQRTEQGAFIVQLKQEETSEPVKAIEDVSLNKITVTGEKLNRSLQDTTSSVSVFDAQRLENSPNLNDLYDVIDQTPNVMTTGGNYDFAIRGIVKGGQNAFDPLASTIGVFVDGVVQGNRGSQRGYLSTWDMEQIEIFKGPQSTNQGRNSLAGAIVLKSKDPEFDANGALKAGYGEANTWQLAAMQTGAITDNLAFRVAFDKRHTDNFITNPVLGEDDFERDTATTVRGKLLQVFDNGAEALLTVTDSEFVDHGFKDVQTIDQRTNQPVDPRSRQNFLNDPSLWQTQNRTYALNVTLPISDQLELVSLTTKADEDFERHSDEDASRLNSVLDVYDTQNEKSQEFRLVYSSDQLDANLGVYYGTGDFKTSILTNDLAVDFGGLPVVIDLNTGNSTEYTNKAIFFNADYKITNQLTLISGLRWDKDERASVNSAANTRKNDLSAFDPVCVGGFGAPCNAVIDNVLGSGSGVARDESSLTELIPKIGVNYQWNENVSTGAVYSRGYRPGGVSVNLARPVAQPFDAEFTDNYELSFRSNWMDERLTLNANLFYTDWSDQQINVQGEFGSNDTVVENVGESTLYGLELEGRFELNNESTITASLGHQKSEIDKVDDPDQMVLEGNEFQYSPNLTASLGYQWRNGQGYFFASNVNYTGKHFNSVENDTEIGSRTLVDLKAGYEGRDWGVYAYVNNLFDRDVILDQYDRGSTVGEDRVYSDPRAMGVTVQYSW